MSCLHTKTNKIITPRQSRYALHRNSHKFFYNDQFSCVRKCTDCGEEMMFDPTQLDIEEYLQSITCQLCNFFGEQHSETKQCFANFSSKIEELQDKVEYLQYQIDNLPNQHANY